MKRQINSGFTLIELMIVVAVIAIIAAFGYPSYRESVIKSRRADAKAALSGLQLAQEKYRAGCTQYATAMGASGTYSCVAGNYTLEYLNTSPDGYYTLTMNTVTATTYTLNAAPTTKNGQDDDAKCENFTIDESGTKAVTGTYIADPDYCWE
jgi:type IV pilus assembly protein PilE